MFIKKNFQTYWRWSILVENDSIEENHINDSEEVTKETPTSPLAPELEMSEEHSENSIKAAMEEIPPTLSISNVEAPAEPEPINGQEEEKTVEEMKQSTEKECDKNVINSEITDTRGKKKAVGEAKKAVQKESPEELAKKESILNVRYFLNINHTVICLHISCC